MDLKTYHHCIWDQSSKSAERISRSCSLASSGSLDGEIDNWCSRNPKKGSRDDTSISGFLSQQTARRELRIEAVLWRDLVNGLTVSLVSNPVMLNRYSWWIQDPHVISDGFTKSCRKRRKYHSNEEVRKKSKALNTSTKLISKPQAKMTSKWSLGLQVSIWLWRYVLSRPHWPRRLFCTLLDTFNKCGLWQI